MWNNIVFVLHQINGNPPLRMVNSINLKSECKFIIANVILIF